MMTCEESSELRRGICENPSSKGYFFLFFNCVDSDPYSEYESRSVFEYGY